LNGRREGKGKIFSLFDESHYIGEFMRDAKDGEGYQFIEDVEEYTGKFSENKKNGLGHLKDLVRNQIYEGIFINDMKQGDNCTLKVLEPQPYEIKGTFKHGNLLSGESMLPDGSHY
jgi:hypothetical protein